MVLMLVYWKTRLTETNCRLSDNPGDKAGNPVVSPDGKYMSFSLGKALDEPPGAGYGLFLLELDEP